MEFLFLEPKVMNNTLGVPVEEPEEYKITPVQSRRRQSKLTASPPLSPATVPITVHYPTSSPSHKPSSFELPPKQISSPTKGTRHVQFAKSVFDPPPVPPRTIRLSSFSSHHTLPPQSPPPLPPLSAPATSPPPSFSFLEVQTGPTIIAARNPIFGRCSSSSETDIKSMFKDDEPNNILSSFASDGEMFSDHKQ